MVNFLSTVTTLPWCTIRSAGSAANAAHAGANSSSAVSGIMREACQIAPGRMAPGSEVDSNRLCAASHFSSAALRRKYSSGTNCHTSSRWPCSNRQAATCPTAAAFGSQNSLATTLTPAGTAVASLLHAGPATRHPGSRVASQVSLATIAAARSTSPIAGPNRAANTSSRSASKTTAMGVWARALAARSIPACRRPIPQHLWPRQRPWPWSRPRAAR